MINMSDGKVGNGTANDTGNLYGGYSASGDATNNTVNITGGQVLASTGSYHYNSGYVYGGRGANATGNKVNMSGGTVSRRLYGGFGENGDATNNEVIISGDASVGYVTGGSSDSGDATNNTVIVNGVDVGGVRAVTP